MNIPYIIIFTIVFIVALYTFFNEHDWHESNTGWKVLIGVGSFFTFFIMLAASFCNFGERTTFISKANVQKIGDVIIVQVDGWPVQSTSDIKFLNKPLSLTKTIKRNAWGVETKSEYTVSELILPEAR